jgi:pimeloyl-ACP methyl ester carboxylesterase
VHVRGVGERAMVFAHGFGCDQNMWRFVAPAFESDFPDGAIRSCRPAQAARI